MARFGRGNACFFRGEAGFSHGEAGFSRGEAWGYAAFALIWAAMAWPWLSGAVTIPYDAKAHFQAQLQFLANSLHGGQSPFWTPHVFAGSPQVADPQSLIFSPAILLAALSPAPSFQLFDAYVFGLLLAGGFAVIAFGRERGWPFAAAMLAALVFAFGGSSAWRVQHVGQIQSLACFAIAFWLLARALRRGTWVSGAGAGLAAGLMIATPDQIAYLGVWVLAGYGLWFLLSGPGRWERLRLSAPALAAGTLAGLAVAALPILLAYLFSQASSRDAVDFIEAGRGSLHPAFLLTSLVGDLFNASGRGQGYWGPSSAHWNPGSLTLSQNMGQLYLGALPLLAVALWLLAHGRRIGGEARFLLAALLAMVIYALGWHTPLFALLFKHAPGVDLFRRPADATFLIGAVMAYLAGFGLSALMRPDAPRPTPHAFGLTAALVSALLALAIAIALGRGMGPDALGAIARAAATFAIMSGALLVALRARPPHRHWLAGALVIVAAVDLGSANAPNIATAAPPARYAELDPATPNDTIAALKRLVAQGHEHPARRDRVELLGGGFHWPNLGMVHGFDHVFGYNPLHLAEFTEATGAQDHMGAARDRRFTPLFPSFRSPFADLIGLRYIFSDVDLEAIDRHLRPGDLRRVATTRAGVIYENPRALPRAFLVPDWRLADFEEVARLGWPAGVDPRRETLLEEAPPPGPRGVPTLGTSPDVVIHRYANSEITLAVDSPGGGLLVLTDVWHPWWRASLNGEDVPILKANVLFRAVAVGPGRHALVFRFEPWRGALAELVETLRPEPEPSADAEHAAPDYDRSTPLTLRDNREPADPAPSQLAGMARRQRR